jgi:hypothetical protein
MTWVSVHVFYHGELDVLLTDAVRPLTDDLRRRGLIDGFFFLRYWDGGKHLRVRLRSSTVDDPVEELALAALRRYLAACPSPDFPDLDGYPAAAAAYAEAEGVTDYLREPMPNNTAHAIAYVPETERYGQFLAAAEQHFVESSRIALGLITAGTTKDQRHTAALSALLLTWWGGKIRRPAPNPGYAQRYAAQRDALGTIAARMDGIARGTSDLPESGALSSWWRSIRAIGDRRVADLCAHLLCNRLGLSIGDEQYVRYLAARAALDAQLPVVAL